VAPICPPIRAHWRHLANTTELVLLAAHPSPQPKRHIDQCSHLCKPHGRLSCTCPGMSFSLIIAPWYGARAIWTPSNKCFFGSTRVHNPNGISVASAVFAQLTPECCREHALPDPENCPFLWGIWTPSNTWFIQSTQLSIPNAISIGSAVFAQLTADSPYTLYFTMGASFQKNCPSPWGLGVYRIWTRIRPDPRIQHLRIWPDPTFCRSWCTCIFICFYIFNGFTLLFIWALLPEINAMMMIIWNEVTLNDTEIKICLW